MTENATHETAGIKALLFDLDGTVAETDSVHFPAWADILRQHGYEVDRAFFQENISGRLNPDIVAQYIPGMSAEDTAVVVEEKEVHFRERVGDLQSTPGLSDFISVAKDHGLRVALVTNAPRANADAVIDALRLEDHFDPIIVADEVSAGKPDPAPYIEALKRVGARPEEAIAFEDSKSGIASALAAGIKTVGVASTQSADYLLGVGAFAVVNDFTAPSLIEMIPTS